MISTVEYKMFGSPTSTKYFNSILKTCDQYVWNVQWRQWKGTPCSCYISSIFITSCWWWWFWLIWGSYHHLNTLITHMRLDTVCSESSIGWLSWSIRSLYWLGLKDEVHARRSLGSLQLLSTARLHFPRCDFTCQNKGSLEVVQLVYWWDNWDKDIRSFCKKKTSGHCKYMQNQLQPLFSLWHCLPCYLGRITMIAF